MKLKFRRSSVLLAVGIAMLLQMLGAGGAVADDAGRIAELERRLEENTKVINKLLERVRELEKKNAQERGSTPHATAAPPPAETAVAVQAPVASDHSFLEEVTWLHGFADVGLTYSGRRPDDGRRRKGFSVGSLDFYLTPQVGTHVKSLVELIFEMNHEGETEVELERFQIGYSFSDYLSLWGGRYHTPLGYWNTAFHHGKQFQTTVGRPKFLDFEDQDGVVPTHMTGLWGTGTVRAGSGKMSYDLYLANGPKVDGINADGNGKLDANSFSDDNYRPAIGFNVGYDFGGTLDGLRLGVHCLHSDVDGYDRQGARISQSELNVFGGYGVYTADDWEIIGEFYQFLNRDRSGGTGVHSSSAGFLQAGRLLGSFTPYARFEFASFDQGDNYFNNLKEGHSYRRGLAGVRFDLTPKAALKLEGNHTRIMNRNPDDYFEISSQFAIRF